MEFVTEGEFIPRILIFSFLLPALIAIVFVLQSGKTTEVKVLWVIIVLALPFLGPLLYLLARLFFKKEIASSPNQE